VVFDQASGVVLNRVEIPAKGCEIAAVEPALKSQNIEGQVVTLDALHTPVDTARYIVEEKHAHYLLNLQATAAHFAT